MLFAPPQDVIDVAGPVDGWEPVDANGGLASHVWLTSSHAIKSVPLDSSGTLEREAFNRRWLGDLVAASDATLHAVDDQRAWLVGSRLIGVPSHRPDLHGDVGSLAEVAGNALRELHSLAVDLVPAEIEQGWDALDAAASRNVEAGLAAVDEPYQRYSGQELLELWRAGRPATEDLVICHGNAELPNMMAKQGAFMGWVDLASVRVADRHVDLAYAHESIQRHLGPEAVYVFYDAYGQDSQLLHLDHYLLARQLMR